jgi:hypothetical protein
VVNIRIFRNILDWIAIIGGVLKIIISGITFLVGSFLGFTQTFGLIYSMYKDKNKDVLDAVNIHPSFWKRMKLYFLSH